jgi:flavin reductase (DIM6/NTAB) family NADH-FMN oxidoreductase RutF
MTLAQTILPPVAADEFRDVVGRFASGVTVITTARGEERSGMTASAMCSVSLEPPMLLVCINRQTRTGAAVQANGVFAVNILGEHQAQLAAHFASPIEEKFAGVITTTGDLGCPLLDDALAVIECRVVESIDGGTHSVYLGQVAGVRARDGRPLAHFRGRFSHLQAVPSAADNV